MTMEKTRSREVSEDGEVGSIHCRRHSMECWEYVLYPVITGRLIKNVFTKIFKIHKYSETNITNTNASICKSFVIVYQIFLYIRKKVLLRKKRDISSPVLLRGKHYQEFCFYPLGLFFMLSLHTFIRQIHLKCVLCAGQDSRHWGYSRKQNCQKSLPMWSFSSVTWWSINMKIHEAYS